VGGFPWNGEEIEAIRGLYPSTVWPIVLKALPGRSKAAVRCKVIELGIKKTKGSKIPWTGAERMKLRELYPKTPWPEIEAALPRHAKTAISKQANMLKLRRDSAGTVSRYALFRELRVIRRRRGLTQVALGRVVGVHPVQIAKWERGETVPRMQNLIDWIEGLGYRLSLAPIR
jgi:DNA-binding transcriptional regulator YiaG